MYKCMTRIYEGNFWIKKLRNCWWRWLSKVIFHIGSKPFWINCPLSRCFWCHDNYSKFFLLTKKRIFSFLIFLKIFLKSVSKIYDIKMKPERASLFFSFMEKLGIEDKRMQNSWKIYFNFFIKFFFCSLLICYMDVA